MVTVTADEIMREAQAGASASSQAMAVDYQIMTNDLAKSEAALAAERLRVKEREDELRIKPLALEQEQEAPKIEWTALEKEKARVLGLKKILQDTINTLRGRFSMLTRPGLRSRNVR